MLMRLLHEQDEIANNEGYVRLSVHHVAKASNDVSVSCGINHRCSGDLGQLQVRLHQCRQWVAGAQPALIQQLCLHRQTDR